MKNNIESSASGRHIEVILVIPLGVEGWLFPWGVHSLREYLGNTIESIKIKVWDFRSGSYFEDLNRRYGKTLGRFFLSLSIKQVDTISKVASNPYIFFGLAAFTGNDFFKLSGLSRVFRGSCSRDLHALHDEVKTHIVAEIGKFVKNAADANRIWAISVYDNTLFNSLHIARIIRQEDPDASIILGGDHFNFFAAEETFKNTSLVDGIVTGYGEEVMRRIILEQQKGIPIRELQIQGLVNDGYFRGGEDAGSLKLVNVPPLYKDLPTKPVISYIQQHDLNEIRILSQRGCSWGKCSFCAQFDKSMFFPISLESLIDKIKEKIESAKAGGSDGSIKIVFDSDENNFETFTQFIKFLDGIEIGDVRIDIVLWLQVKGFRYSLAREIAKIKNKNIHILFRLNFESLNLDTLKNMRKGHLPLKAVEAAKVLQDTGHSFFTNYFTHFPLENRENISEEIEILKRVLHLFMPPKGTISLFPYSSNNRDELYQNQAKYKVRIKRIPGDIWLKHVFGIDLPFSMWSHTYVEKPSFDPDRLLIYSYYQSIKAVDEVNRPFQLANSNWEIPKRTILQRISFFSRFLKLYAWKFLHFSLQIFGKEKPFLKRTKLFLYLARIIEADNLDKTDTKDTIKSKFKRKTLGGSAKREELPSYFYLEKEEEQWLLKKAYNAPGDREKWSMPLDKNERDILRYFYSLKRRHDGVKWFMENNGMTEVDVNNIIDKHIKLGALLEFKGLLLSAPNDPGYWKEYKENH